MQKHDSERCRFWPGRFYRYRAIAWCRSTRREGGRKEIQSFFFFKVRFFGLSRFRIVYFKIFYNKSQRGWRPVNSGSPDAVDARHGDHAQRAWCAGQRGSVAPPAITSLHWVCPVRAEPPLPCLIASLPLSAHVPPPQACCCSAFWLHRFGREPL